MGAERKAAASLWCLAQGRRLSLPWTVQVTESPQEMPTRVVRGMGSRVDSSRALALGLPQDESAASIVQVPSRSKQVPRATLPTYSLTHLLTLGRPMRRSTSFTEAARPPSRRSRSWLTTTIGHRRRARLETLLHCDPVGSPYIVFSQLATLLFHKGGVGPWFPGN